MLSLAEHDPNGITAMYLEAMKEDEITPDMFKHHDDLYLALGNP